MKKRKISHSHKKAISQSLKRSQDNQSKSRNNIMESGEIAIFGVHGSNVSNDPKIFAIGKRTKQEMSKFKQSKIDERFDSFL